MKIIELIGVTAIVSALIIGVHHFTLTGTFYQLRDVLHHEFFIALLGGFGLGVLSRALISNP